MKTVRAALWPMPEKARRAVTPEMEHTLRTEFAPLKPSIVAYTLQAWRPLAVELAEAKGTRERRDLIDRHAATKPQWALYAQAAWLARALALAEHMERTDLAIQPKKWAGHAALNLLDEFEADLAWLWPFESESPWPDDDDWIEDAEA